MKKTIVQFLLLATALSVAVYPVAAQGAPPTLVVTDVAKTMDFHDQISLSGRTEAWVASRIVAEISGRVDQLNAGEGKAVRDNAPLVSINSERSANALKSKEAEVEQARLRAMLAADALERAEDLFARRLIPETSLDSARSWSTITEHNYLQLEAERQQLTIDLNNCVIKAPFSGYTGRKLVDVGEWVDPGTPVFELVDISRIRVRVDLPERVFGRLSVGSPVLIQAGDQASQPITGKVVGISPNASEETHTFPVIIQAPNPDGRLAGGMLVRATLTLDDTFSGLAVSKDAIVRQGSQTLVYTVADNKAVPIPVVITSTNGKMVAVQAEGLQDGGIVVVRGNERIFPGAPVMIAAGSPSGESAAAGAPLGAR